MIELLRAHKYQLGSIEGTNPQIIQFYHKEVSEDKKEEWTIMDGTTDQDLLDVLISRNQHMAKLNPENNDILYREAIRSLQQAKIWLDQISELHKKLRSIEK